MSEPVNVAWNSMDTPPPSGVIMWLWDGAEVHLASHEACLTEKEYAEDSGFFNDGTSYADYVDSCIDSGWFVVTPYGDETREIVPLMWASCEAPAAPSVGVAP